MVDVGGDDGTAGGYLVAHELGGDVTLYAACLVVEVLADGHVLHLGSDDALAGVMELGDTFALLCAARLVADRETDGVERGVVEALQPVAAGDLGQFLGVAALLHPLGAEARQAGVDVSLVCRVGVRTGGVV